MTATPKLRPVTFEYDELEAASIALFPRLHDDGEPSAAEPPIPFPDWPSPQPLTARVEAEPYPFDALPAGVQAAVAEVQAFVQAPLPLIATCALSALSLAAQAHFDVQRTPMLRGPISLFTLIIAESGERKSSVDGLFMRAIRDYEARQAEIAKPMIADYLAAHQAWEARCGGLRDRIRQLSKEGKPLAAAESELRRAQGEKPEEPRVPRLIYGDATPEALGHALARRWPSGGIMSSEAGSVFGSHGMAKDSALRTLALLNTLWDGGSHQVDRRTSDGYTIRGTRLTVGLQVQEAALREFLGKTGALARGSGFLARFLICWPESTQGTRFQPEQAITALPAIDRFNDRLAQILARPAVLDDDGALLPGLLTLEPEAEQAWRAFADAVEAELRPGGELHRVRDVAAKVADNAARIAALFQMYDGGGPVTAQSFAGAARVAAWHLSESRRFFGELALPTELAEAARLDSWLLAHCRETGEAGISTREAQRQGPIRCGKALAEAVEVLAELGRARLAHEGKRKLIEVNPELLLEAKP